MALVKERLAKVAQALGLSKPLRARAVRRCKANRKRAFVAHNRQDKAQLKADRYRSEGHPNAAATEDKTVARCKVRAEKNHARAQHYLGVVKRLTQRIEGLMQTQAELEAALKKISTVTIKGNTATGGSKHERLKAVALASAAACASGRRANFYSQTGTFDAAHCITGPALGHRDDCSSWFASVYKSAGLADPSGEQFSAGYTGTLVASGTQVSRSELKPGDAVIYGPGSGHHVEMFVGPGDKTIGHGSAPVDAGVINLFGDSDYRCFTYGR